MKFTKKQLLQILAALLVILLLIWGFWPEPISVKVDRATVAPLEVAIEEEGKTRVTDRYTISAPVTGYCLRLRYEVGDTVRADQELFQIQPIPDLISARQRKTTEAQLEAAKARLAQARENLRLAEDEQKIAEKELQRFQKLFGENIGSEQQLDNAELAERRASSRLASAEFSVKVAEHEVEAVKSALQAFQTTEGEEQIAIHAPVGGRLLKIHHKSEGTVQTGTPILEIGDPYSLEIQVDLLSTDAVQIKKGTMVRIKRWGSGTVLDGTVRLVEPSGYTRISALGVEEQRVPVIIDILSPQSEWRTLGDGFRIVAEFIIWQGEDVLQVPSSALFRNSESWALFVVEGGKARLKRVDVGHQSGLETEITGGLEEGEAVITHPDERIEEGVNIEPLNN